MYKLYNYEAGFPVSFDFLDLSGRQKYYEQGYKGKNVIVAVIDTGVSPHPELEGKILPGKSFCYYDSDGTDDNGHGTHVAGTIAGANCGIAPEAKILPIKVLTAEGWGNDSDVIKGLLYARDWRGENGERVDIVSMSLGSDSLNMTIEDMQNMTDAVNNLVASGIIVICAAGNTGKEDLLYPASIYECVTVGAVDDKLTAAYFSTHSKEVDLAQVGVNVTSCNYKGGYISFSGTSQATPIVSGIAALIASKYKALFRDYMPEPALYHMLKLSTADLDSAGVDMVTGAGFCSLSLPQEIKLKLGEKWIEKNGVRYDIDVAPFAQNERTFTPTRHTHEMFGDRVTWIPETEEIIIKRY